MQNHKASGPVETQMKAPPALRIGLVVMGAFVVSISIYELWGGVWPINFASAFFLFIILGALGVGGPMILSGLFGWEEDWIVEAGRITIARRNPFRAETIAVAAEHIDSLTVIEREQSEGPNTFAVFLSAGARRFQSRDFGSREAAERHRDEILAVIRR
ncbi:MAG: hypothetical protein WBA44_18380 [Mesorhizobium sp.]